MVGIVSYGAYVPIYRIKSDQIARVWGMDVETIKKGLGIQCKSVPAPDEDTITISVECARNTLKRVSVDTEDIEALYIGSESHPYAVKPSATIVAVAIGATPNLTAADYEFACKAGTAAIQTVFGMVKAGNIKYGLAIGADTSQGAPGDTLEYSAAAGGAAYLIGRDKVIAEINKTLSFTTDTPDFWRREGAKYPLHGGRFTGEPAYFKHVTGAAKRMMAAMNTSAEDYDYVVLHQPNAKFPRKTAKMLGFKEEQVTTGLLNPVIGNLYSGSTPIGLAAVLDESKPSNRILAVSFGSGAGSDAFDITLTDEMNNFEKDNAPLVQDMLKNTKDIDYSIYAKYRGKILMQGGD